jgi:hypothetical protein
MTTMYRSKPIFTLFQGCIFSSKVHHCILWKCSGPNPFHSISGLYIFIQGRPLYPMEMFRSKPISCYFRAVYFSSKVECVHTACGPKFYNYPTIQEAQLWNLAPVNSYFVPSLTFCESIWIVSKSADINPPIPNLFGESMYIWPHKEGRFSFGGSRCSFHWEMMGWWWWQAGL